MSQGWKGLGGQGYLEVELLFHVSDCIETTDFFLLLFFIFGSDGGNAMNAISYRTF